VGGWVLYGVSQGEKGRRFECPCVMALLKGELGGHACSVGWLGGRLMVRMDGWVDGWMGGWMDV